MQVGRLVRTKLYLNLSILGNLNDRAEFTDQSGRFLFNTKQQNISRQMFQTEHWNAEEKKEENDLFHVKIL